MKTMKFPCVVVTQTNKENKYYTFISKRCFVNWAERARKKGVVCSKVFVSVEDVARIYGDDRDTWPEELKKDVFPVFRIIDENGNERLDGLDDFMSGDFWLDVWLNDSNSSVSAYWENDSKHWKNLSEMLDEIECLGWKIRN